MTSIWLLELLGARGNTGIRGFHGGLLALYKQSDMTASVDSSIVKNVCATIGSDGVRNVLISEKQSNADNVSQTVSKQLNGRLLILRKNKTQKPLQTRAFYSGGTYLFLYFDNELIGYSGLRFG